MTHEQGECKMLDINTGRFVMGEGLELYPGMKREDFYKSKIFKEELRHSEDKDNYTDRLYDLKVQNIDGFLMDISVMFSSHDYLEEITLSKPEYYDWPNWPEDKTEEEYAYEIKAYNDAFVAKQLEGTEGMGPNEGYYPTKPWGYIRSNFNLRHMPHVEVVISYNQVPILKAAGYTFGKRSPLDIIRGNMNKEE